jgi:hypothetical protein
MNDFEVYKKILIDIKDSIDKIYLGLKTIFFFGEKGVFTSVNELDFQETILKYIDNSILLGNVLEDSQIHLDKSFKDYFHFFYSINMEKLEGIMDLILENKERILNESYKRTDTFEYEIIFCEPFIGVEYATNDYILRLEKINSILADKSQKSEESPKIKWNGNASQLGFIINQLAKNGFIQFPFRKSEINYTELARQVLNAFELNKETNEKYMATQINIDSNENKLSEENKIRLKFSDNFPYCKDL